LKTQNKNVYDINKSVKHKQAAFGIGTISYQMI